MPEFSADRKYAALVAKYRASLPHKAARILSLGEAATAGGDACEALRVLEAYLHQLSGSAAVYGLRALSECLIRGERDVRAMRETGSVTDDGGRRLARVLETLRAACVAAA